MKLKETIRQLPDSAGIYQYFDKEGHLLYIGKAKSLLKRVKSYFIFTPTLRANPNLSHRIKKMISQAVSINYIVVNSEHDALILENSLIKQLHPKYNILLRDDKTYPYIYIDTAREYPRLEITRKVLNTPNIQYYGPFSVGARDILNSIYEICKLVQKKGSLQSKKLCLYYQIGKCLGPCENKISKERYDKELEAAKELLLNKEKLLHKLKEKMHYYAENLRFEEASELRDRCERIQRSHIKSEIDFASNENYDIFVIRQLRERAVVVRIFMRGGRIISSSHDFIRLHEGYDEDELYQRALIDFYSNEKPPIIAPILVASEFHAKESIENYLSTVFEKKAHIRVPKRGEKRKLIELGLLNAAELLKRDLKQNPHTELTEIRELFSLQKTPYRVEIFDNSHMSGSAPVGAMVIYENGLFDKKSYRLYHLNAQNEYAQMRETLTKRVQSFSKNQPPDLWILDGGETLLRLALDILQSQGVNLEVIAISKEKVGNKAHRAKGRAQDIIYTKERKFELRQSDKRLQWVQKLRDEAHRSAINFHKKTKLKQDQQSRLLELKGISQAKIVKLLKYAGTFEALKKMDLNEIASLLNKKDAQTIKNIYK